MRTLSISRNILSTKYNDKSININRNTHRLVGRYFTRFYIEKILHIYIAYRMVAHINTLIELVEKHKDVNNSYNLYYKGVNKTCTLLPSSVEFVVVAAVLGFCT